MRYKHNQDKIMNATCGKVWQVSQKILSRKSFIRTPHCRIVVVDVASF